MFLPYKPVKFDYIASTYQLPLKNLEGLGDFSIHTRDIEYQIQLGYWVSSLGIWVVNFF